MNKIVISILAVFVAVASAQAQFVVEMKDGKKVSSESPVRFSQNGEADEWSPGETYDAAMDLSGVAAVYREVSAPPQADPKIGDYYYSDGTWSDGGLVSIDPDGLNPVWAETKPAPLAGKTVVGIVCQTNPARIAESDKAAGYTHGYVIAVKNAHGQDKATTWWTSDMAFECLKSGKLASTLYATLNGYEATMTVKETYAGNMDLVPAFDWTLNEFSLEAPESSSGWFIPSSGQLWDALANLCGHEVAEFMKEWQAYDYDASYYCSENVDYDVIARFNSTMSEIPADAKEELTVDDEDHDFCSLWTSTPYDAESVNIMEIGTSGLIECMANWFNADCYARPILAF